jgi:secondary thiamine-phosphate synthase enzyme
MTVESRSLGIQTRREGEVIDITDKVQAIVENSKLKDGVAFLFVPGSTAALTTLEYEPGLVADLPKTLEKIVPKNGTYEHEKQWQDGNGHSHVRAALMGPDLFVPVRNHRLMLGTWQQIVFVELDVGPATERSSSN